MTLLSSLPRRGARGAAPERGFSLIELLIVAAIIGIIAAISVPILFASRRAANEANAIASVRTLSNAQQSYRAGGGQQFATLDQLVGARLVDGALGSATTAANAKSGYLYAITLSDDNLSYCIGAAPVSLNAGSRNFSSDSTAVIYAHPLDVVNPPTTTAGGTPVK